MLTRSRKLARMLVTYRNPELALMDRLSLIRRRVVEYRLRPTGSVLCDAATADVRIVNEVWIDRIYDAHFGRLPYLGTVLDLGAQKGVFTVYAAKRLQAIVFEKHPKTKVTFRLHRSYATIPTHHLKRSM